MIYGCKHEHRPGGHGYIDLGLPMAMNPCRVLCTKWGEEIDGLAGQIIPCQSAMEYDCHGVGCSLPFGHEGDHVDTGESLAEDVPPEWSSQNAHKVIYEIRWRKA